MLDRSLDLPPAQRRRVREYLQRLRRRVDDAVDGLLAEIPQEPLARRVEGTAFVANDLLPKRRRRPKLEVAVLIDRATSVLDVDDERAETLLQFALAVQEYYDIFDDVVDGDVADGRRPEVVATWQVLFPLNAKLLSALGDEAVDYWSPLAMGLMEAPLAGVLASPSPEEYRTIVRRQTDLFAFVTGLCGVVGSASSATIDRLERLGRAVYRFEQYLLDGEQYAAESDSAWNAWALFDHERVRAELADCRSTVEDVTTALPDDRPLYLRSLVALDMDD